jgi:ubiquinone/menaquinone biosynthesis C-methylase UbiE
MNLWDWKSRFYVVGRSLFPFNLILNKEDDTLRSLISQINVDGRRSLDAGTGTGKSLQLLPDSALTVGVDRSLSMVERAKRKRRSNFVVADVNRLPFKARSFGLITAVGVIEYQKNPVAFLKELHRVVAPDGFVVLTYAQPTVLNYLRLFLLQRIYMLNSRDFSQAVHSVGFTVDETGQTIIQRQVLLKP